MGFRFCFMHQLIQSIFLFYHLINRQVNGVFPVRSLLIQGERVCVLNTFEWENGLHVFADEIAETPNIMSGRCKTRKEQIYWIYKPNIKYNTHGDGTVRWVSKPMQKYRFSIRILH